MHFDSWQIIDKCPSANELTDRSITFPIFSGLFVLIKANAIVQDSYCSYEQSIVRRFVEETKLVGTSDTVVLRHKEITSPIIMVADAIVNAEHNLTEVEKQC